MSPFLDDEDNDLERLQNDSLGSSIELGSTFRFSTGGSWKFFLVGGVASVITFAVISYVIYSSSKPIDLEDLPVIKADATPIKIRPPKNMQIDHQDKIVYDNISGNKRNTVEKIATPPEEVLSINEVESNNALSKEEKKKIISAFDDLAPEKEYKINCVKSADTQNTAKVAQNSTTVSNIKIVEDPAPPIKNANALSPPVKNRKKTRIRDLVTANKNVASNDLDENWFDVATGGGASSSTKTTMVQVASLPTKREAEVEFKRLLGKNKTLRNLKKKVEKVDLGQKRGVRYRIKVGPMSKQQAQQLVSILHKGGCSAYLVR